MFDELFPIVMTRDVTRALAFYLAALGGEVTYRFPTDGDPDFVALTIGQSAIGVSRQDQPAPWTNNQITLWIYASDCDEAVERLRAAGVPIMQEPQDQPWGERTATVFDPDGNRVIIGARTAKASRPTAD